MTENRDPESRLHDAADKASDKLDEAVGRVVPLVRELLG